MSRTNRQKHAGRPTRNVGLWLSGIILFLITDMLVWWWLAPARKTAPPSAETSVASTNANYIELASDGVVFSHYAGAASCRDCHREEFASWENSNHALAERPIEPSLDRAAFDPPRTVLHGADQERVQIENGKYEVTTTALGNTQQTFVVQRVIGRDPLRQFLVSFPGGRLQTLAASYDPRSNEWFNVFGDEGRKPGEWGHWTGRGMNWNSMCAACHNTRVRKNYDAASDSYETKMAEATVSCEACHGPLKAHNEWQQKFGKSGKSDPTISKLSRPQIVDNCGFCHARRSDLTGDFKPGDRFHDHFNLATVDYSDNFYADGQNHLEDYEYTAFLGSRMHFRGVICMDCHDPHSLKTVLPGNWLCMRCHDGSYTNAPVINPVSHSHHKVFGYDSTGTITNRNLADFNEANIKETGGECVNCHMPQTVYMQRHWRHDHGFTIPDPLLTKNYDIPNACNRCHQDKNADWSLGYAEKWYGAKMDRLTRRRAEWIARAKDGDASARDGLLKLMSEEEIPYWRAVEAGMLAPWVADEPVSSALIQSLNDTNALVRATAVQTLGPLVESSADVAAALRQRLNNPARNVRVAAAWALRQTLDPDVPAAKELKRFLEVNADQPTGQLQLGAYSFSRNKPEDALAHLKKAVAWDPGSPPLREELAVVLSSLNHPKEALDELKAASRLAPRDAEIHYKLGLAYNETGDLQQTIAELKTAVQLAPRNARAWYNLGLAQNANGRTSDAIESLLRGESAAPDDPRIPYARATILARLGRIAEAREAADRALEIQPGYGAAQQLLQALPQ